MHESDTVVVQATVRNPNGRDLHGLAMSVSGVPAGLSITPTVANTTLNSGCAMLVPITVSTDAGFSGYGSFPLTVTTTEGVTMQALIGVNISLLVPSLSFSVGGIEAAVLRGGSKVVSFKVTNIGGLETGPIKVLLPDVPWMSLACTSPMPSIPPGGTADVSLLLAPDAGVPLTQFTGSMAVNPANGAGRAVDYKFRVVSDMLGDLTIDVVDELFFYTAAAPKLAGAQVVVMDAITSAEVASITTGADGVAAFIGLPEGWYHIDVSAAEHDGFSQNYYLNAGHKNTKQVLISKQLVKYSWKVEDVAVQDVYRVTIDTKFETNVPAPVVTATPSSIDVADLVALGQSKVVNITLENHGLIGADNSRFRFTEHPFYSFTPLVSNIGTIPALSSLVVPMTVRRIGVFGDDGGIIIEGSGSRTKMTMRAPATVTPVPCIVVLFVDYNFLCGKWLLDKYVAIAVNGVQGKCADGAIIAFAEALGVLLTQGPDHGWLVPVAVYSGGFYGDGREQPVVDDWDGVSYYDYIEKFVHGVADIIEYVTKYIPNIDFTSEDPCLATCTFRASVDCLIGFTPIGYVGCIYNTAQFIFSGATDDLVWMGLDCGEKALKATPTVGTMINVAECIYDFGKCYYAAWQYEGDAKYAMRAPDTGQFVLDADFRNFAPEVAEAWSRCETVLRMYELHYGSKELVLALRTGKGALAMTEYESASLATSPGGTTITSDEAIGIEALSFDAGLDLALVQAAIDRWNRTVDYRSRGIRELADVPAGESTDFIDNTSLRTIAAEIIVAYDTSRSKGYIEPFQEFRAASTKLKETLLGSQGGTCAKVKIQLSQDVVMTRSAFRATLDLENSRADGPITQVGFNMQIRDEFGQPAEDLFNIDVTRLTGLAAIDGTGEISAAASGSAQWTFIPRDTAAQVSDKRYTVGGVIHYVQSGTEFNIPVANVPITVKPDASLVVRYFHQRDVFADDPHTDTIEPSIPFKLAMMVGNNGHGDANNLRITSGQPQIVDNEKGLFVGYKVIATEVDGIPLSPSLTADFGTLSPGQTKIATWYLTGAVQGMFTDYAATFKHVTGLGDTRLSLIEDLEIHEMIRMVRAQGALDDGAPDFLTNDVKDVNSYPDTIHFSNGGTDFVTVRQSGTFSGAPAPDSLTIALITGAFDGWSYVRLPDPAMGNYRLVSATRGDGRVLPMDFNVWQSDRTFIGVGRAPLYENILHLVDSDSSGVYTLVYALLPAPDTTSPSSSVNPLPAVSTINIPVTWDGSDDCAVSHYDVYVAVDGGAYDLWKDSTTESGAMFVGSFGNTYHFYSIATDSAGNRETKAPVSEAITRVALLNQAPVIAAIGDRSANEGGIITVQVLASDPDGPRSSIHLSIESDRPGVVLDPVTGIMRWSTSEADGGAVAHVTVTATDSGSPAAAVSESFAIAVDDVNTAPVITQVGQQTLESNGALIVDADATDGDSPAQALTFSFAEAPMGAIIDASSGVIHWMPDISQAGQNHAFTVSVVDNGTPPRSASMSFSVTVTAPDRAPVFTRVPVVLWLKGKTYSLSVAAADPDGDPVSLMANTSAAAGAVFSDLGNGSGSLFWNTTGAGVGTYQVPVTATAKGLSATATLRIKVESDELYWQWAKDAFGDLPDGYDVSLLDMDADPDGDGRGNVHEMAFLTNPLVADSVPLKVGVDLDGAFATIHLNMHRRVGSNQYVELDIAANEDMSGPWQTANKSDWTAYADAAGDDDGRAETEEIDFYLFELYPSKVPPRKFYRVESTKQ
jgi:hypothetical protein